MPPSARLALLLLALAGLALSQPTLQDGAVSTLIGGGKAGNADGDRTVAAFAGPGSLSVVYRSDSSPLLLLTDQNNAVLRLIDVRGQNVTTVAGTGQSGFKNDWKLDKVTGARVADPGTAMFYALFGVVTDSATSPKTVYVADRYNNRIRSVVYSEDLSSKWYTDTIAGTGEQDYLDDDQGDRSKFNYPVALEYDASAKLLYVSDALNHVVRAVDCSRVTPYKVTTVAGTSGTSGFVDGPASSALFNFPYGLALDSGAQILYVSDFENNAIRYIRLGTSPATVGTLAGQAGKSGWSDGKLGVSVLNHPVGVRLDPRASSAGPVLYFSEAYGHRVRFVYGLGSPQEGTVATLSGNGTQGQDDGVRDKATFSFPLGIAVEASGPTAFLYVADRQNNAYHCLCAV
eukprot:tig00000792_g4174.t1